MDIPIARRFALTAAVLAFALAAALACQETEEEDIPGRGALLTPEASPTFSPTPSPSPSPAPAPADLPPPAAGYEWFVAPQDWVGSPLLSRFPRAGFDGPEGPKPILCRKGRPPTFRVPISPS